MCCFFIANGIRNKTFEQLKIRKDTTVLLSNMFTSNTSTSMGEVKRISTNFLRYSPATHPERQWDQALSYKRSGALNRKQR